MLDLLPFLLFITVSAFTPGPNNLMALSHAGSGGLRQGLLFSTGVFFGMLAVMLACGLFSDFLAHAAPQAENVMRALGALYMLWLGLQLWKEASVARSEPQPERRLFFRGLVLQLVNPKIIVYGLTAFSVFLLPLRLETHALALYAVLLAFMGFLGTMAWAACGSLLEALFRARPRLMNRSLALLMGSCAAAMYM